MDSIPTTTPQQFCLRWHNHQASLLSSLPLLLDQSHLTDVTLSAEGRTVRAHRVVLSACSTYFSELFRTLEPPYHPIVVLPGTPFGALVALLTFMYSGEVNVFEEQISTLLALAETLGIKGLADFNGNLSKSSPKSDSSAKDSPGTPEHHPSTSPLSAQALHQKIISSSLDNLFCKSFPFYSNFMNQQPLNFSRSSSRSRNDINTSNNSNDNNNENRYQSPLNKKDNKHSSNFNSSNSSNNNDNDDSKSKTNFNNNNDSNNNNNNSNNNNNGGGNYNNKKIKITENMRKIDKIAENLRIGNKLNGSGNNTNPSPNFDAKFPIHLPQATPSLMLKSPLHHFLSDENQSMIIPKTPENLYLDTTNHSNLNLLQQHANDLMTVSHDLSPSSHQNNSSHLDKNANNSTSSPIIPHTSHITASQVTNLLPPATKPSNSKLYATCFICHKQLSNQYNLRVHLETHQNVRYACTVCTHVSRSKDALRKHVSYRHPGTPSPCDSETRRKRSKTNLANQQIKQELLNLEQHNSQLQQIIQSAGQANQFTQLLSPAAVNSLANLNLSLNAAAAAAAAANSGAQHNNTQNNNDNILGASSTANNNSPTNSTATIKSELTATDSNENV